MKITEKQELLNKMFPITSLCRTDLIMEGYNEKDVLKIPDSEMDYIARKIGDGIMEDYWLILNYRLEDMGYKKKKKIKVAK